MHRFLRLSTVGVMRLTLILPLWLSLVLIATPPLPAAMADQPDDCASWSAADSLAAAPEPTIVAENEELEDDLVVPIAALPDGPGWQITPLGTLMSGGAAALFASSSPQSVRPLRI